MSKPVANIIKKIRKKHELTQAKFAEIIEISSGHVGMLEQGRTNPSYEIMDKIISKYDIDANLFFQAQAKKNEVISKEMSKIFQKLTQSQLCELETLLWTSVKIIQCYEKAQNN